MEVGVKGYATEATKETVQEIYGQLTRTMGDLDTKIAHVLKKHENELLLAYQTHMNKLRRELTDIKNRSEEQERQFSSDDRICYLQSQTATMRTESLNLYKALALKTKEANSFRSSLQDLKRKHTRQQQLQKDYLRSTKHSLINNQALEDQLQILSHKVIRLEQELQNKGVELQNKQSQLRQKQLQLQRLYSSVSALQKQLQNANILNKNTANHSFVKLEEAIPQIKEVDNGIKKAALSNIHSKMQSSLSKVSHNASLISDSQLKDYIRGCIRVVRKQIARRTQGPLTSLSLNSIKSFEDFKMVDKLQLLELVLSHEKILTAVYQTIFPDERNNLQHSLKLVSFQSPFKQTSQDNSQTKNGSFTDRYADNSFVLPRVRIIKPTVNKGRLQISSHLT